MGFLAVGPCVAGVLDMHSNCWPRLGISVWGAVSPILIVGKHGKSL